jgi:hypothetical protein
MPSFEKLLIFCLSFIKVKNYSIVLIELFLAALNYPEIPENHPFFPNWMNSRSI